MRGGGLFMNRRVAALSSAFLSVSLSASLALANAPEGGKPPDYSGISYLYYTLIGLILAYGAYDIFFKKSS
jgi:hypothetical protein